MAVIGRNSMHIQIDGSLWGQAGEIGPDRFTEWGIGASLGRDCALDRVTAHKWLNIAAANGSSEAARLRTELAAEMTRDEIAQAQRLAREYLAAHRSIG